MVGRRLAALCVLPFFAHAAIQISALEQQATVAFQSFGAGLNEETCLLQAGVHFLEIEEANSTTVELVATQEGRNKGSDAHSHANSTHRQEQNRDRHVTTEFLIWLVCLTIYAGAAIVYELKSSNRGDEGSKRVLEWDAVRLFVQVVIVAGHIHLFLGLGLQLGTHPGTQLGVPLKPMDALKYIFRDADTEDMLYSVPSMFKMPSFCFISGVFGQKVDRSSMLRVCCYTYGTLLMYLLMETLLYSQPLHPPGPIGKGHLWYLKCLFLWRFTLSPLFSLVQSSPMPVKLALFALVSCFLYTLFDLSDEIAPHLYAKYPFWLPVLPQSFSFGPYFALGLLLPHPDWSALLQNRTVQIMGVFVFVVAYGYVTYDNPDRVFNHWPVDRDPQEAFSLLRLRTHGFWFVYKAACTFGVIWATAAFTSVAVWVVPAAASRLLSGGSRSMYSYVLHYPIVCMLQSCGAREALVGLGTWHWFFINCSASAFIVLVLTTRLTEKIFEPVVMPFWLLEIPRWLGLVTSVKQ